MTVIRQIFSKSAKMQALVDKFEEHETNKTWDKTYVALQNSSDTQTQDLKLTHDIAVKEHNQIKNRYCNVIPYDQNRVLLSSSKNDYINASPMHSDLTARDYIFAQGPLESTSADFWSMVYEKEVKIIVMLTDCIEWGQNKCHSYFPTKDSQGTKRFGIYILELVEEKTDGYTVRKLKLTPKKGASTEPRIIHHFQFTNWPDFGVPEDSSNFERFVEAVRDTDESFDVHKPIVAHCSAGIGRSGTFVVADIMLTALRSGKTDELPMVDELVLQMRKYRMYLVQTPGQLRFCWKAVVNWINRGNELEPKKATKNGDAKLCCKSEKQPETNGDTAKEEEAVAAITCSPGKRASTDEDLQLQKRRKKIEDMKRKGRIFEEKRNRRFKNVSYIVGVSAIVVGVSALLIYRYMSGSASAQSLNII